MEFKKVIGPEEEIVRNFVQKVTTEIYGFHDFHDFPECKPELAKSPKKAPKHQNQNKTKNKQ